MTAYQIFMNRLTPRQRRKFLDKQAMWAREKRKNMTPKQRESMLRKMRESNRMRYHSTDPEVKAKFLADRRVERLKLRRRALRNKKCQFTMRCKEPQFGESVFCFKHWAKKMVVYPLRESGCNITDSEIQNLWNLQNGRCAISGVKLTPGKNVSLDHIVPFSRGGKHSLKNLRFVHRRVNDFKGNLLDSEFKSLLRTCTKGLTKWAFT